MRKTKPRVVLLVPEHDLNKPFAERQFPFRPATVEQVGAERAKQEQLESRAAMHEAISGVENMIHKHVIETMNFGDRPTQLDLIQDCRLHLWRHALPRYDALRLPRTKVSSFLSRCIQNFIYQAMRGRCRLARSGQRLELFSDTSSVTGTDGNSIVSRDWGLDDRIAAIAEDVLHNPLKYLSATQVEVFQAMTNSPGVLMKDLAKNLGYMRPSSLSTMMQRIRKRITDIDIEGINIGHVAVAA